MLPFTHVSHVSVTVFDLDKATRFCGEVIGLTQIPRPDFGFPGVWYSLGKGLQFHVIVNEAVPAAPVEPRRFDVKDRHFALRVDDADETYQQLVQMASPSTTSPHLDADVAPPAVRPRSGRQHGRVHRPDGARARRPDRALGLALG